MKKQDPFKNTLCVPQSCIILGIWLAGCALVSYRTALTGNASERLSGIVLGGVAGEADYKAVSLWISNFLAVYLTIGLQLFAEKENRLYLLYRCSSYKKWRRRMWKMVLRQAAGYAALLYGVLALVSGRELWELAGCIILIFLHTVFFGGCIAVLWEMTRLSGSILVVLAVEYALIAAAYYFPNSYGTFMLPFLGMQRYILGIGAYVKVCAAQAAGIAVLVVFMRRKVFV